MSDILPRIEHPHDLKKLSLDELQILAGEIRERIMDTVDQNGGHLASNLGSVELTLALHRVFDLPQDRLVWDTSHQTYPHKLLTGRQKNFHTLRQFGGICGFCNHKESVFDLFDAGHAGTAASLALGTSAADKIQGRDHKSVAVVGDAAIAAGMAFEALNHGGAIDTNLLVILNDNDMAIDHSVGALSNYLNKVRTKPLYQDIKKDIHEVLARIPLIGKHLDGALDKIHGMLKHSLVPGLIFQELGFNYYGPFDGHDLHSLIRVLEDLKGTRHPVLLHLHTVKGFGFEAASRDPIKYHALKDFKRPKPKESAKGPKAKPKPPSWSDVFKETIHDHARRDRRIAAITAAMPGGTGLMDFKREFPDRYFDVGIAEQHGCAFSSGMAYAGMRPVFAVYSTFCQRAYDQIIHDVCIQEKSVIFCLDRAGIAGEDGWTHHGVFDISYMRCIPNVILMAPRDAGEFRRMFQFAVDQTDFPVAIRYPKATVPQGLPASCDDEIILGRAEVILEGEDVAIFAYGAMVENGYVAAIRLRERGINVTVVDARFAKPVDVELLRRLSDTHTALVTIEENVLGGGFGSAVVEVCTDEEIHFGRIVRLGVPDEFITFGSRIRLLQGLGLDAESVAETVEGLFTSTARQGPRFLRPDGFLPRAKRTSLG